MATDKTPLNMILGTKKLASSLDGIKSGRTKAKSLDNIVR
jgi:hypothetical protein